VALRHPLAGDLPLSAVTSFEYGRFPGSCQRVYPRRCSERSLSTSLQPTGHASFTGRLLDAWCGLENDSRGNDRLPYCNYSDDGGFSVSPCTVFSQKDGVTTSCHRAFTAAIDIITQ
jgi:hypothetical protein